MTMPDTSGVPGRIPPSLTRRTIALRCTLTRVAGSPISACTIDLGPTGMRVTTERPLAVDETVAFDLPCGDVSINGHARVVCQERPDVYAVRFGRLPQPMERCLRDVVDDAPQTS